MATSDLTPEHPRGAQHTGNIADELAKGQTNLAVSVVSPARSLFEGPAHWVVAPGVDGLFGVWPGHMPLVAALAGGPLRIGQRGGVVTRYAVRGGFLEVGHDHVTILVDAAVAEPDAPGVVEQAKADLEETKAALQHPKSDFDFIELQGRRSWDLTRIKMGGGSGGGSGSGHH